MPTDLDFLELSELTVEGRVTGASNASLVCTAAHGDVRRRCMYKPVRGERPLWDFPDGTLAGREVAAFVVSEALGWSVVPPTVLRDGPFGPGMVQLWIDSAEPGPGPVDLVDLCPADAVPEGFLPILRALDQDGDPVVLVHADDERLRRMALFDAVVNNADRKGGHVIESPGGHVYGVDHGISLHSEDKLRTVLWGWAGDEIPAELLTDVQAFAAELGDGVRTTPLAERLHSLLTMAEVAALVSRTAALLAHHRMPVPGRGHPIPWPPF